MPPSHNAVIYWFRRTLRLDDNAGLLAAAGAGKSVIPVFILDPAILTRDTTGTARTAFLFETLAALDADLRERGGRLIIRHGEPVEELTRLARETGAGAVYFARDYTPTSRARDKAVKEALRAQGVAVETFSDHLLVEPDDVRTKTGQVYTVFTPYKRVWLEQPIAPPRDAPARIATPADVASEAIPTVPASVGVPGETHQTPMVHGGEADGRRWLDDFLERQVREYDTQRDLPAAEGTSRLSAYLRMGVVSPRRVFARVKAKRRDFAVGRGGGADTFVSELAWRDFYYAILYHFPYVAGGAFRTQYNEVQWENNPDYFAAWCAGKTGYPFVDAAMRQMNTEAWMHNRARMVVASFLCKDLLCDWRLGEKYFMQQLVDGDQASNNGGWQWAAGTGTDAQPFFRIFNPVSQGEKFDPDGAYVKRWIPELARIPAKFIHRPWELSAAEQEVVGCVLGRDYPRPIVDHKTQREKALQIYRNIGNGDETAIGHEEPGR